MDIMFILSQCLLVLLSLGLVIAVVLFIRQSKELRRFGERVNYYINDLAGDVYEFADSKLDGSYPFVATPDRTRFGRCGAQSLIKAAVERFRKPVELAVGPNRREKVEAVLLVRPVIFENVNGVEKIFGVFLLENTPAFDDSFLSSGDILSLVAVCGYGRIECVDGVVWIDGVNLVDVVSLPNDAIVALAERCAPTDISKRMFV